MEVLIYRQSEFNAMMRKLRSSGGEATIAFKKVAEIKQSLEMDLDSPGRITNHGESRIRHAVKYRLSSNYRLVTLQTGGVCLLLFVGKHDDCDRWLNERSGLEIAINRVSNRLEVVEITNNVSKLNVNLNPSDHNLPLLPLISGFSWELEIPNFLLREATLLIEVDTPDDRILMLAEQISFANKGLSECILQLIDNLRQGKVTKAQIIADLYLKRLEVIEPNDKISNEIIDAPINADTVVRLGKLNSAQIELWSDPKRYQEWMLFLHPDQKRVVDEDYSRLAILSGVSGSGKTCALVHRAKRLAMQYDKSVLILTLNGSLAELIRLLVNRLHNEGNGEIEVMSYYQYVEKLLGYVGEDEVLKLLEDYAEGKSSVAAFKENYRNKIPSNLFHFFGEREMRKRWREFHESYAPGTKLWEEYSKLEIFLYSQQKSLECRQYIKEELDLIRSVFRNVDGYRGYDDYRRYGRSVPLQEYRRKQIRYILKKWEKWQLVNGFQDQLGLTQLAAMVLDDLRGKLPESLRYRSVLVDEFQDLSTLDLQLLSAIPTELENGLFIAGDTAQRVFTKDLDVSGGGSFEPIRRRIRKNYRNTRQILEAATLLLEKELNNDGAKNSGVEVLNPEYAERDGPPPITSRTNAQITAAWAYAAERISQGYMAFSICIATADSIRLPVDSILDEAPSSIKAERLTGSYILDPETVIVAELNDVKGFEFCLMVILGLEAGRFPSDQSAEGEIWRDAMRLYVGMTRARDELRLLYSEKPSRFIEAMSEKLNHYEVQVSQNAQNEGNITNSENNISPYRLECESLNGYNIIRISRGPTQLQLAEALGSSEIGLANFLQQEGLYATGATRVRDHHVIKVFKKYHAVPRFYGDAPIVENVLNNPSPDFYKSRIGVMAKPIPRIISESGLPICQHCGKIAMYAASVCYDCSPD